jgi:hypothetical protein
LGGKLSCKLEYKPEHNGISVLQRYLKQTYLDTEEAHQRAGPVDNSEFFALAKKNLNCKFMQKKNHARAPERNFEFNRILEVNKGA